MLYLLPLLLLAGCATAIQQARQKEDKSAEQPKQPEWVDKNIPEHGVWPPSSGNCAKGHALALADTHAPNVARTQVSQSRCGTHDAYVTAEVLEYFKEICPDGGRRIHALLKVSNVTCR